MPRKSVIISLTEPGKQLAQRIVALQGATAKHLHRPSDFVATVQKYFGDGYACLFICATGIVIRSLAPVLRDKHRDPPVLVMDDQGQYVIPLLSGHEGGANQWAADIAGAIQAQLVITSAKDYVTRRYVLGMGCVRGCELEILRQLYLDMLELHGLDRKGLMALVSVDLKQDETALNQLASELGVPFITYSADALRTVEDRLTQRSETVFKEVGCYGVAEAAALYHADGLMNGGSRLIVDKMKNAQATLAVAQVTVKLV